MIILFDSSAMNVVLHVINGDKKVIYNWEAGRTLAKELLKYLENRLAEQGGGLQSVTGIGVFKGPGSYTGLRIGITVLNTLAESLNVPIVGTTGDNWADICTARLLDGESDRVVLPEYGSEANITKPKK